MPEMKLGQLLITNNLITKEQFDQAMKMQQVLPGEPIGHILVDMGYLKKKDLEHVLDHNNKRRKLGEILLSMHLICEDRLKGALKASKDENVSLGKTLLSQNLIDEEQLARAVANQYDLDFAELSQLAVDPKLATFVNATFAHRLKIVPVAYSDKSLTIAMAYPIAQDELARLELWCKVPIVPVIATEKDIALAQHKIYKMAGKATGAPQRTEAKVHLEITEDQESSLPSKYSNGFISADVENLTKQLLFTGIRDGTSDIHLESDENGMVIRFRLDGVLQPIDLAGNEPLIRTHGRQIVSKIKILCDMDIAERRRPQDGSFKMKVTKEGKVRSVDFRVSTVPTQFGENVVIRILDKRRGSITLEGLGYQGALVETLHRELDKPTGIFLVTGPTGSGKSSTLYALLSRLNTPGTKSLTIEDPIEYTMDGITQTEVNEVIGNTFARMLRAFLRQDPDNIMVGEIRDLETATISMRAALTGHSVLSTLHTNDATSAVTRLTDMGVEPSLLSDTLRCVLAQRLVRRLCTGCKVPYLPSEKLLEDFGLKAGHAVEYYRGNGCESCHFTGFNGRLPIVELWIPTREELTLIHRRPDNTSLRNAAFSLPGRLTMIDDGLRMVRQGETTLEELARAVPHEQIEAARQRSLNAAVSRMGPAVIPARVTNG